LKPIIIHTYGKLIPGTLIKRYKRFLADVTLEDGSEITAFTPNSGSMKTCSDPGSPVMLTHEPKPERKTEYTLEMVKSGDTWVGVHTSLPNQLAATVIDRDLTGISELNGLRIIKREATFGDSRFDILVGDETRTCYVEVKNVTYKDTSTDRNTALFPDAVTTRGAKHLRTLMKAMDEGHMAVNIYCIQRSDCSSFAPAVAIDPEYAETFHEAREAGVIMVPLLFHVTPERVGLIGKVPIEKQGLGSGV
jgi:sugar fermentation stimulation protein A